MKGFMRYGFKYVTRAPFYALDISSALLMVFRKQIFKQLCDCWKLSESVQYAADLSHLIRPLKIQQTNVVKGFRIKKKVEAGCQRESVTMVQSVSTIPHKEEMTAGNQAARKIPQLSDIHLPQGHTLGCLHCHSRSTAKHNSTLPHTLQQ